MSYAIMRDAIYDGPEAVDALITIDDTDQTEIGIRALYMPGGADLSVDRLSLGTVKTSASIRRTELTEKGVSDLSELDGATIVVNGETWSIKSWVPLPYPSGEASGELRLILTESNE